MSREVIGFDVWGQVVTYMSPKEVGLVYKAMTFSEWEHRDQERQEMVDGQAKAYYTHPLAVAAFLVQQGYDAQTIAAAFLHDVVEDIPTITVADIAREFGPTVAFLVEGVTKVKHGQDFCEDCTHKRIKEALAKDKRVLAIKLADRYHNLQTLRHMGDLNKQALKVKETLDYYVPLAQEADLKELAAKLYDLALQENERIESMR